MKVDPADWRLEVERVAPRLKITVASNARDWRSHLDDAHKYSGEINSVWPDTQAALGAVQAEVRVHMGTVSVCLERGGFYDKRNHHHSGSGR